MRSHLRAVLVLVFGAALLGFVSGEMAITDLAIHSWFEAHFHGMELAVSLSAGGLLTAARLYTPPSIALAAS